MTPLTLHEYALSGNCYKIRLTAAHVGVALERLEYDIIPVLQVGERFLPESNAACFWLADDGASTLIPPDRWDRADMLRWMSWEQYNHEPNIATMRFWLAFVGEANLSEAQRAMIPAKMEAGNAALALMEEHLSGRDWFVGRTVTLADICLYAYTHTAAEGGFVLADYPEVTAWLARVAGLPGHVAIDT
jgi:glutathione S-transferase